MLRQVSTGRYVTFPVSNAVQLTFFRVSQERIPNTIHGDTQNTATEEVLMLWESPDSNSIRLSFHFQKHQLRSLHLGEYD